MSGTNEKLLARNASEAYFALDVIIPRTRRTRAGTRVSPSSPCALAKQARAMGSVASKDGKGAVELPWRAFKSPREQAKVLPTFLACESIFGVLAAASLAHAKRTGNVQLWFYGWMCGTANDALFMLLPFVDNFWHAQACVMLTPRLPLYIPGVYAVFTYASIAAARKFNLPYLQEAALAGLLSHLVPRQENAPIGSSTWVLTYCAAHAVLSRWVNDAGASLERSVAVWLGQRSGVLVEKLNTVLRALDRMHSVIVSSPSLIKIAFCGLAGTPLFMALMGVFQVISFDKLGIPGQRTDSGQA
ncbi:Hypothetical Protein FCC1311_021372 [Hondaea fermentalgiana]|uniref:DUF7802 domain-containing protein n=1 Tax=Hondaea fermentalgiana TaxID=2315210 RepID=A0A2R5G7Z9_9STRA|nr:Hypothetical Protein FCC1311_021372 [Hondaea fermentalgiana]|eukprot:GBG25918.1 Hypothetical Protein FCC1311_021372 [Hondaea fermentalgiana]